VAAGTNRRAASQAVDSLLEPARRRTRRATALLLSLVLAACCVLPAACTTAKPIVPNDTVPRVYVVDCSGASLSWSHCYQKAGRVCPQGYKVTQKPYKHGGGRVVGGDFLQLLGNSAQHRRMLITCRDSATDAPDPAQILSGHAG
jgi:hypothetical protein